MLWRKQGKMDTQAITGAERLNPSLEGDKDT